MTGVLSRSLQQNTVILRTPGAAAGRNPNDGPGATVFETLAPPADITVDVEENLDRDTLHTILNDPTVVSFAPAMPIKLVEPLEATPGFSDGAAVTWGVEAVGAT